jgi:hypothetical protein
MPVVLFLLTGDAHKKGENNKRQFHSPDIVEETS